MENYSLYSRKIAEYIGCSDYLEFAVTHKNCKLLVLINSKTHVIENVIGSSTDEEMNVVLCIFSDLLCKIPILEANDHGVMRLEMMLRDENMKEKPVKGIIMPENSSTIFLSPLYLIRKVFSEYCIKNNYQPVVNTYIPNSMNRWKALDKDKKEQIISEKIDYFCKKNNIIDYTITLIGDTRVEFSTDKEKYSSLAELLFNMERTLNKEVQFPIEIMFTEKKDTNRKRQD